jgi:hypothetical protein
MVWVSFIFNPQIDRRKKSSQLIAKNFYCNTKILFLVVIINAIIHLSIHIVTAFLVPSS